MPKTSTLEPMLKLNKLDHSENEHSSTSISDPGTIKSLKKE
jgi:hypothetical protein